MDGIWQLYLNAFSRRKIYVDVIFTEFAPNGPIVNNSGNSLAPKVDKPKGMLTYRQLGP